MRAPVAHAFVLSVHLRIIGSAAVFSPIVLSPPQPVLLRYVSSAELTRDSDSTRRELNHVHPRQKSYSSHHFAPRMMI